MRDIAKDVDAAVRTVVAGWAPHVDANRVEYGDGKVSEQSWWFVVRGHCRSGCAELLSCLSC